MPGGYVKSPWCCGRCCTLWRPHPTIYYGSVITARVTIINSNPIIAMNPIIHNHFHIHITKIDAVFWLTFLPFLFGPWYQRS